MDKVLVVDDEDTVTDLLKDWLEEAGYTVFTAGDGLNGLQQFFAHQPHVVILDIMMPRMDGLEVCRRIREVSGVPVIFLTAKGLERDKVKGLTLGGDDYIPKPVGGRELRARVAAALRRARMPALDEEFASHYSDERVRVDFLRHEVFVRGELVNLTPLEYRLMNCFVRNPGQVLTPDQLLNRAWGSEYDSYDSVKWHIASLRRKIEETPQEPKLIVTVRGVGYRYEKGGKTNPF
ncbi:MAG: response regulator transcription factor [Chloroflexi bacterium]|nr:response regulator transcription factor [Chloroflexota bacterium]